MSLNSDFEEFWKAYPRRPGGMDRAGARSVFAGLILSGVSARLMTHGAACYKNSLPDKFDRSFVQMPANWLKRRGWEDYDPPISDERFNELYAKYKAKEAAKW